MNSLSAEIGRLLTARGETLAVAESCTGGYIANEITNVPGASGYFDGGVICYSNAAKIRWLHVSSNIIDKDGAVSRECAEAMAAGVRKAAGVSYGISVTGIAGPTGGTPDKSVGTVFVGLATSAGVSVQKFSFPLPREAFKAAVCNAALGILKDQLKGK